MYLVTKAGGTKQQTKLQKTEGDLDALRSDLAQFLGLESGDPAAPQSPDVTINRLTGHILVKVWHHAAGRLFPDSLVLWLTYRMTGLAETRNPKVPPTAQLLNNRIERMTPPMNIFPPKLIWSSAINSKTSTLHLPTKKKH